MLGGTVFPELVTQGTSWDIELVEEIAAAIALETRAVGVTYLTHLLTYFIQHCTCFVLCPAIMQK